MKKVLFGVLALVATLGLILASGAFTPAAARVPMVLIFDRMAGLPPAYTGTQNPIRGVNGGGLPWTLTSASGFLRPNGKLEIVVTGLVFAAGPNTGSNTVPNFRAVLSCLDVNGQTVNVSTGLFPATLGPAASGGGNAIIDTTIALPYPCIAPIIFVTSPGGAWFAVTGR